jgi:acyl-CoA thioesterase
MSEFDDDTAVEPGASGIYRGTVSDRWGIAGVPNGGYILALAGRALLRELDPFEPMTVTGHYLGMAQPGPVEIAVDVAKRGKRTAAASARMIQNGKEHARVLATYGVLPANAAPTYSTVRAPEIGTPDRNELRTHPPAAASIAARLEVRAPPGMLDFQPRGREGAAEIAGWIRFADGRAADPLSLLFFADAFPPPIFHVVPISWVPTLELTVHVRARPASAWLLCAFRTRLLANDLLDEEGEIWDEHGTLVAMSRQLARPPAR